MVRCFIFRGGCFEPLVPLSLYFTVPLLIRTCVLMQVQLPLQLQPGALTACDPHSKRKQRPN